MNKEQEQENESNITDPNLLDIFDKFRMLWKREDGSPCSANQALFNMLVVFDVLAKREDLANEVFKEIAKIGTPDGVDGKLSDKEMSNLEDFNVNKTQDIENPKNVEIQEEDPENVINTILESVENATIEDLTKFLKLEETGDLSDQEFLKEFADFVANKNNKQLAKKEVEKAALAVKAKSNFATKNKIKDKPKKIFTNEKDWLDSIGNK